MISPPFIHRSIGLVAKICVTLLLLLAVNPLEGQNAFINVITYNLRLPNPEDGLNYWGNRRYLVVNELRFHAPDIFGVQEAFRRQINEITLDLPQYGWYGVCRDDGSTKPLPDGEFSAIFYRKDRFRLMDGGTFWLSQTPDQPGSKGWDAAYPRIVTWAMFRDEESHRDFYHFNTHFDHMGQVAREESAKFLLHAIDSIAGELPVVVTGDFNCTKDDAPYRILTNPEDPHALIDAISISEEPHFGPRATFSPDFQISGLTGDKIDYIFVRSKAGVKKHAVLSDNWLGKMASDHLPVFARIYLKD